MIVDVVATVLASGVTFAGLNEHSAIAGNPLHEKVIGLANEPCGVTVMVNVPGCPEATAILAGFGVKVKSAGMT